MLVHDLPYLDLTAPGFSTRSDEVMAARESHGIARTPYGLAILRYKLAGQILRDRRCRQGSHDWPNKVGISGSFAGFWSRSVISQEGDRHKQLRAVAQAALREEDILALCPDFETIAQELLQALPSEVEFVDAFSEPFAGRAIALLLGLPPEAAAPLARDASTLGLMMGLDAPSHEAAANGATDRLMALAERLLEEAKTGFVARLRSAAEAFALTDRNALLDLIVIAIFGGVDTTRAQLAFACAQFARAPHVWDALRQKPEQVAAAIDDVIRQRPTTTWATRETIEALEVGQVRIPAGTTLHVLVHAASTDPEAGLSGGFDPERKRKPHFGFGAGAHHCLGHFVARTDMACALRVLLREVRAFEWAGTPQYHPDSGNTSPIALPLRLIRV